MKKAFRFAGIAVVTVLSFGAAVRFAQAEPSDKAQTGSINGTVLKEGKPVANVKVGLILAADVPRKKGPATQPADSAGKRQKPVPVATTVTDADGKFTLESVAPGDYVVMASAKADGKGKMRVSVANGESASISIDLQPPKPKDKAKKEVDDFIGRM